MSTFTRRLALASLPLMLVVAACSSSGGASTAPSTAPSSAPSAAASEAPSAAPSEAASEAPSAAAGLTLALADTALGKVIVDGEGKVLYLFTPDEAGGEPTCYDTCAENWPPLTADAAPSAGDGLDASKITLVARTDGTQQVKYGEYPLYYFAGDAAAGETNGQGLNEKWYVLGADGEEITGS